MLGGADTCLLASVHSFTLNPCSPYPASGGELLGHALNFPFAPPQCPPFWLSFSTAPPPPAPTVHSALPEEGKSALRASKGTTCAYPTQATTVRGDPCILHLDARSFLLRFLKLAANTAASEDPIR